MGFYVYILRCSDDTYYAGHTDDLEKRMAAHERGEVTGYTTKRRPVRLVFAEAFASRDEAFRRERQIKGWSRGKKAALIRSDWSRLVRLARAHGSTGSPRAGEKNPLTLSLSKGGESLGRKPIRQRGFTFIELMVAIGVAGLMVPMLLTSIYQLSKQTFRDTTRITALTPLESAGRWLNQDIPLGQDVSLADGGSSSTLSVYWTDWSDKSNYDSYTTTIAYKRIRATYSLAAGILYRTMATCANTDSSDVKCTSGVVTGAAWTDNTKWVTPIALLTANASSGQNTAQVNSTTGFLVGQTVTISDLANSEKKVIASLGATSFTFTTNLANTYSATGGSVQRVLVLTSSGTFNSASRATDTSSPIIVARKVTTINFSRSGDLFTITVTSYPEGLDKPGETETYKVYGTLLGTTVTVK